jgi:short-subunit dehydrogenase
MPTDIPLALITGAGTGIGRALAVEAARRGYRLVLAGRRLETLARTAALLPAGTAHCVTADVTTHEGRAALVEATAHGVDVAIQNAGIIVSGPFETLDKDDVERLVATNLTAPVLLSSALLPALRAKHGRLVFVGSVLGDIGHPHFAAYCATKHGLRGLADALRRELAADGITVTYAAPRATETPATDSYRALIGPFALRVDSAETVARQIWNGIARGDRSVYPLGLERLFIGIQRLLPRVVDYRLRAVGRKVHSPKYLKCQT